MSGDDHELTPEEIRSRRKEFFEFLDELREEKMEPDEFLLQARLMRSVADTLRRLMREAPPGRPGNRPRRRLPPRSSST